MGKKIFILLFFLFVLISMSSVSALDLDGNNNVVSLSNDAEAIDIANDVNAIDDLNENCSDGDDKAVANDVKSVAVGENNEFYGAAYEETIGDSRSEEIPTYISVVTYIAGTYDPNYVSYIKGYVGIENDPESEHLSEGIVRIMLNDKLIGYAYLNESSLFTKSLGVLGAGEYKLGLEYSDNSGKYATSDYVKTFNITKAEPEIVIDNSSIEMYVGESISPIPAHILPSDIGFLHYSSNNLTVIFVMDASRKVYANGEGTADIIVSYRGNENYTACSKTISVTVKKNPTNITLNESSITLFVDDEADIGAVLSPSNAGNLTYSSDNPDVANVSESGHVTAKESGTAVITVSFGGNDEYARAENKTVNVTVKKIPTYIILNESSIELSYGESAKINPKISPSGLWGLLIYYSNDTSVATVDGGNITGKNGGTALITVSYTILLNGTKYANPQSKKVTVNVKETRNSTNIVLDDSPIELVYGQSTKIEAELDPSEAGNLSYSSNDNNVVRVSESGDIKAVGVGSAIVTVSFGGNDDYARAENKTVNVTVKKAPTEIILRTETIYLRINDSAENLATLIPAGAGGLTYTSNSGAVEVIDNFLLWGFFEGIANVTVSFRGNKNYEAAESKIITVYVGRWPTSIVMDDSPIELVCGQSTKIGAQLDPPISSKIKYSSNDTNVVRVSQSGDVEAVGVGAALITASYGGDQNYLPSSKTVSVTVKYRTEIAVAKDTLNVIANDFTLAGATLIPGEAGSLTYNSSNSSVAIVMNDIIIPLSKGQAIITVSFAGNNLYAAAENKTITVNVELRDASISVENSTLDLNVGDTYAIDVTTNPPIAKQFNLTFISSDESVVTVDKEGKVTAVGEGSAVITVGVGDDMVFAKNSTEISVTVNKGFASLGAENLVMTYKDGSCWNVTLTNANGGAIVGGVVEIGINIDGLNKVYSRKTDANGVAGLPINLAPGSYAVNATFDGNGAYHSVSVNATVTVKKAVTTLSAENLTMSYKDGSSWNVTLTDDAGNPIAGVYVNITFKDKIYRIKTDASGVAKLPINLLPGSYNISASLDNAKYEAETVNATITVNKATPVLTGNDVVMEYKDGTAYNVTLTDSEGNPIANSIVKITIGNKTYSRKTDAKGVAALPINLAVGNYAISAKFEGNSKYGETEISNSISVNKPEFSIAAEDVNMTYKDGTSYNVQLTDKNGNPFAYAGESIIITLNGASYDRKTNADGIASLPINLSVGSYELTAEYNDKLISNTVTVNKA